MCRSCRKPFLHCRTRSPGLWNRFPPAPEESDGRLLLPHKQRRRSPASVLQPCVLWRDPYNNGDRLPRSCPWSSLRFRQNNTRLHPSHASRSPSRRSPSDNTAFRLHSASRSASRRLYLSNTRSHYPGSSPLPGHLMRPDSTICRFGLSIQPPFFRKTPYNTAFRLHPASRSA